MKIFVLEDNVERIRYFYLTFGLQHDLVCCNNAEDAKDILSYIKFALIFLDHDLGGVMDYVSREGNDGKHVAKHVGCTGNMCTPVFIHSWNIPEAQSMAYKLKEGGHKGEVIQAPYDMPEFHQEVEKILYPVNS